MIKPASSLCNLSCEYCFYRDVAEHREHLGFGIMTHETATLLIEKALAFADGKPVSFAFQGGEPTLAGLPYFEHFVRTVREKNEKTAPYFTASRPTARKSMMRGRVFSQSTIS